MEDDALEKNCVEKSILEEVAWLKEVQETPSAAVNLDFVDNGNGPRSVRCPELDSSPEYLRPMRQGQESRK